MVSQEDCSNNFFVDESFKGKPRAEAVSTLLMEMNPDVKGHAVVKDVREILSNPNPKFFKAFSLVLATQLDEATLITLGEICATYHIHLVVARTYGLIGHVRIFSAEHLVVELKPSPEPAPDLRVFNPWPSLKNLADKVDFSSLDGFEFKHLPFVLVLIKMSEKWKQSHGGKLPENFSQKEEFKKSIREIARLPWGEEENLFEAVNNAFQAFAPARIGEEVLAVMQDKYCDHLTKDSPNFWIMARALRDFFKENNNVLPLPGTLPDMTATTARFVELQNCYAEKAQQDLKSLSSKIDSLLKQIGKPVESITWEERVTFCANSSGLVAIRNRTLKDEFTMPKPLNDFGFDDPAEIPLYMNPAIWYLLWRSCDAIKSSKGAYPGSSPNASEIELSADADEVFSRTKSLIENQYKSTIPSSALTRDCAVEMTRYGACEMHNIAALIGGIAAEECVKLLTQQYQPMDNTFIFNGICSVGRYFSM